MNQSGSRYICVVSKPVLLLTSYIVTGVIAFSFVFENWNAIDSIYFCVVTFTTVGYGDLSPGTEAGRLFTIFYAFAGISLIGVALGDIMASLTEANEEKIAKIKKENENFSDEKNKNGDEASANKSKDVMDNYSFKSFLKQNWHYFPMMMIMLVICCTGSSRKGKSFIDMAYFWAMTVTTIGYGDCAPATRTARIGSIFLIPLSTYAMATLIGKYIEFNIEKKALKKQQEIIDRGLRESDIQRMDKDGSGKVTRLEYFEFMLLTMDKVDADDLDKLHDQFNDMDHDGSGELDKEDIVAAIEERKRKNRMRHQKQERRHSYVRTRESNELELESGFDDPRAPLI